MKRIALLLMAVSVLSTFLVACGSGISEQSVEIQQDSSSARRSAGEQWARQQEQKARSDFNAQGKKDPLFGRVSSAMPNNPVQGNSQGSPTGMSQFGATSESSSGDLLKMGAIGIAMMAITQGFNGEKLASALGVDSSKDTQKEESKPHQESAASFKIISDSSKPNIPTAPASSSDKEKAGVQDGSTLSVVIKDAREEDSVKNEGPTPATENVEKSANEENQETKPTEVVATEKSDETPKLQASKAEESSESSSGFKIVTYEYDTEKISIDCEAPHEVNEDLQTQINAILAKASVKELGGSQ